MTSLFNIEKALLNSSMTIYKENIQKRKQMMLLKQEKKGQAKRQMFLLKAD